MFFGSRSNAPLCIVATLVATLLLATPALAGIIEDRPCPAPGSINRDNSGSDFIVGFMRNLLANSVELHLTGDVETMVTVEYPVNTPSFTTTVAIIPGSVTIVSLPAASSGSWTSGIVSNNAVRAFSPTSDEFVAYMINRAPATSDAALGLPIDTMGNEYIAYGYTGAYHGSDKGEFLVVAAFDDTEVTITPSNPLINTPAGTFSVTLNRGEGFFAQSVTSTGSAADITGSIIIADRPVGLTTGNLCTNIPVGGTDACDHSFEVAQPLASWGNSTLAANLPNRPNGSLYRVIASQDNTTVERNGVVIGTINRGEFIDTGVIPGEQNFVADKPIYAAQYMTGITYPGATLGDPAIGNLIPPDQFRCDYTFSTVGGSQFVQNFVSVVAHNADLGAVLLDGVPIPAGSFAPIPGSDFSAAAVPLSDGVHSTSSPGPHGITVEGYNQADSYIYPGGALFESINAAGDPFAPVCSLTVDVLGTLATGSATDNTPTEDSNGNGELDPGEDLNGNDIIDRDTGIFFVSLLPGAANMTLNTDPFVPGDPMVSFAMTQTNPLFPAVATVEVEDGVGNTCQRSVQLGGFDPFGGINFTPTLNITLFLMPPTPNTDGVRCVETTDPDCADNPLDPEACTPDYTGIPFTPFPAGDPIELPFLLSEGSGTKIVCCQFIDTMGNISPPVCSTIVVGEDDPPSDDNVNGLLDLVNFTTQTDPTPCNAGSVGTFILDATFQNISAQASLENLISETAILSDGAVLCNADVAPSGVGSLLTIPEAGDYADGVLTPMETFDVRYEIGLASFGSLDFFVDILGDIIEVPAVETRQDFRNAGTRGSGQNQDLAEGSQPVGASAQSEIRGEGPAFSLTDGLTTERPNKADKKLSRARSRVGSRR